MFAEENSNNVISLIFVVKVDWLKNKHCKGIKKLSHLARDLFYVCQVQVKCLDRVDCTLLHIKVLVLEASQQLLKDIPLRSS